MKKLQDNKMLRAAVFMAIAAVLVIYLNSVFTISSTDSNRQIFNGFYSQEEDSIDVIYIGTSATNRYYIAPKAYEDEGIAAYNLATMGLPMMFVPNLIDEVEKTQNPQLYIIELRNVLKTKNDITDAHIRRVTDSMKMSPNKYEAIDKAMEYTEDATGEKSNIDEGALDYIVPIVKYHSRLSAGDFTAADLIPGILENGTKGFVTSELTLTQKPQKEPIYSDEREELAPEMEEVLLETLDRCDLLDAEVLFVLSPYAMKAGVAEKLNTAIDIVEAQGYTVLNFNEKEITDEMGLSWETDFYNSKHVNYCGAEKYTEYLNNYLVSNYKLPDRRGNEKYDSWAESYREYADFVKAGLNPLEDEK